MYLMSSPAFWMHLTLAHLIALHNLPLPNACALVLLVNGNGVVESVPLDTSKFCRILGFGAYKLLGMPSKNVLVIARWLNCSAADCQHILYCHVYFWGMFYSWQLHVQTYITASCSSLVLLGAKIGFHLQCINLWNLEYISALFVSE